MTQRIFDIENEKDMQDLWDILPDMVKRIEKEETDELNPYHRYMADDFCLGGCCYININFHDKTEITRPIQEATEADIGKLCKFWNNSDEEYATYGILLKKWNDNGIIFYTLKKSGAIFNHARRLTKQEIEELI